MRRRGKIDANQPEIVDALTKAGYAVQSLASLGSGVPDLLVSRHERMWLLEVKLKGEKPNLAQLAWMGKWPTPVYVVRSAEEALSAVMN